MKRFVMALAALCAGLTAAAAAAVTPAPPPQQQYVFQGLCTDCAGFGTGTLTLQDYTPGEQLDFSNFVSFSYTSDLIPSLRIEQLDAILGSVPATPGPTQLTFGGPDTTGGRGYVFQSSTDGSWSIGRAPSSRISGLSTASPPLRSPLRRNPPRGG